MKQKNKLVGIAEIQNNILSDNKLGKQSFMIPVQMTDDCRMTDAPVFKLRNQKFPDSSRVKEDTLGQA